MVSMRRALLLLAMALTACTSTGKVEEGLITTLEGTPVSLEEYTQGKPAIVYFWSSQCGACETEMPLLQTAEQQHDALAVVGVNLQEEQAVVRAFAEAKGYTFVNLLDPGSELKQRFGVSTQPTTLVFDAEGHELHRKDGALTEGELAQWMEELLTGTPREQEVLGVEESAVPAQEIQVSVPTPLLSLWYQGEVRHTIPLDQIVSGVPSKDGIPSVDNPQFLEAKLATAEYDELLGIFVTINDDARFYPLSILNWHEVVNDTVGGVPVSVTYSPLSASALVFERTTSGGADTFGVSGLLFQSNLLLYDRGTLSLWDQIRGEAVVGSLTGERLRRVKSDILKLATVREAWPQAKVMNTITGFVRDYSTDPYKGYDQMESTYFPVNTVDDRLVSKKPVYGIVVDGVAKAYTLGAVQAEGRVQDTVGGVRVLVQYDAATGRVRFTRYSDAGKSEEMVPLRSYWFAWVAQYPETELYE